MTASTAAGQRARLRADLSADLEQLREVLAGAAEALAGLTPEDALGHLAVLGGRAAALLDQHREVVRASEVPAVGLWLAAGQRAAVEEASEPPAPASAGIRRTA